MWSPFGFSSHPLPFMLWASTSCLLLSLISMGLALLLCKVIPSTCPLECLLILSCFLVSRKECHPLFVLYLQQCLHTLSVSYKLAHTSHCLKQNSKNKTFHSLVPSSLLATTVFPSAQVFEWISGPCCLHFLSHSLLTPPELGFCPVIPLQRLAGCQIQWKCVYPIQTSLSIAVVV